MFLRLSYALPHIKINILLVQLKHKPLFEHGRRAAGTGTAPKNGEPYHWSHLGQQHHEELEQEEE